MSAPEIIAIMIASPACFVGMVLACIKAGR